MMSLAEIFSPLLPSMPEKTKRGPSPTLLRSFEDSLTLRLKSLLPLNSSEPLISLSWLSRAAAVLVSTLSDFEKLISDPDFSSDDNTDVLSCYLDSSVSLLDSTNAITAAIDCLLRRRLYLRLAFHHLSRNSTSKAKEALANWEKFNTNNSDLAGLSNPTSLPRGKICAVRTAVYAVELVSCLVVGVISAALGRETVDLPGTRVSAEFPWGNVFNEVVSAVKGKKKGLVEIEAVESAAKNLSTAAVDDVKWTVNIDYAEKATEEMGEKLGRLSEAVEGIFRSALSSRSAALRCFRIGNGQKCK